MGHAAGHAGTDAPNTRDEDRRWLCLRAGWRLARYLLKMVVAMMAGMAARGTALAILGTPPGYANLLVEYGLMGAAMSAPMVA